MKMDILPEDKSEFIGTEGIPVIVDDSYLISQLNLTKGFINRHAKSMGSFCRPRKFFLKNVLCHLDKLAGKSMNKDRSADVRKAVSKHQVNNLFDMVIKRRGRK
jgi:hypothetical protein